MRGTNLHIIAGVVGRDPETRYIESGKAVTTLSVATSERWTDRQTGEIKESTDWHRVVVWGKPAEFAGEHIKKGSKVYIEGKVKTRSYEKDGQKHYTTETHAEKIELLADPKPGEQQGGGKPAAGKPAQGKPAPAPAGGGGFDFEDDILF